MISDSIQVAMGLHEVKEAMERRSRMRHGVIAAAVLLVHGCGLYWVLHQSSVVLELEAGRQSRGSVQVSLVAAPAPQPATPPVAKPQPRPVVKEAVKQPVVKPQKSPVVSSQAPSARTVAVAPSEPVKSAVPVTPPAPAPSPAQAAPAADAAKPSTALATQAAISLSTPKPISAGELRQLGCQIPQPDYPPKARRLQQEGTVLVKLVIDKEGAISSARVAQSSGYPSLDEAAVETIRSGHCQAYTSGGIAQSVEATQPIAFNLNQ